MSVQYDQYAGTRVRCQRVNDAKLFNGWVLELSAESIRVQSDEAPEFSEVDRVAFEVYGQIQNIFLMAQFEKDGAGNSHTFRVLSNLRLSPVKESVRLLADRLGMMGALTYQGETVDVQVLDVANTGAGVKSPVAVDKGEVVELKFNTLHGDVDCRCEVRYCKASKDEDGFRLGLKLEFVDRVSKGRWSQILTQANAA